MGTIIPAYLGNPSLDNYAFTTFASTLHGALTGAAGLPVKVILSIHTPSADVWTESSAAYKVCYKAGEAEEAYVHYSRSLALSESSAVV